MGLAAGLSRRCARSSRVRRSAMDLFVQAVTPSARDLLGRLGKGGCDLASAIDVEIFRPPQRADGCRDATFLIKDRRGDRIDARNEVASHMRQTSRACLGQEF